MFIPFHFQSLDVGDQPATICVPDAAAVQAYYQSNKEAAYWAQVWPAAVGLCTFLARHPQYVAGKTVLELAAGLGLPGLHAARTAMQVCITDIEPLAVDCVRHSIHHQQLANVTCAVMDWKAAIHAPLPELVLLSDVNYAPSVFEELCQVLGYFLQNKVAIILSTPQRLVAKAFINRLQPYCVQQWHTDIPWQGRTTGVSVFVYRV